MLKGATGACGKYAQAAGHAMRDRTVWSGYIIIADAMRSSQILVPSACHAFFSLVVVEKKGRAAHVHGKRLECAVKKRAESAPSARRASGGFLSPCCYDGVLFVVVVVKKRHAAQVNGNHWCDWLTKQEKSRIGTRHLVCQPVDRCESHYPRIIRCSGHDSVKPGRTRLS